MAGKAENSSKASSLPLASLAASAVYVEGKAPRLVAADLAFRQLGEQVANMVKQPGVGAGVGARRAPDGRLVDIDDLIQVFAALDAVVISGEGMRAVKLVRQRLIQDFYHQGGLA
jgi:hypothetical protein